MHLTKEAELALSASEWSLSSYLRVFDPFLGKRCADLQVVVPVQKQAWVFAFLFL